MPALGFGVLGRETPAQVVLRWQIDHGLTAIPKSFRLERIAENIDIFDSKLTSEGIAALDALDTGSRSGRDPEVVHATTVPIKLENWILKGGFPCGVNRAERSGRLAQAR